MTHRRFPGASEEFSRFLAAYHKLHLQTLALLEPLDEADFAYVPIDTPTMYLGKRVNRIHVGGLLRHVVVAEDHWIRTLATASNGAEIAKPANADVVADIPDGHALLARYREAHARNVTRLRRQYGGSTLARHVRFAGRTYTVQGFLWTILAHRSYHLGQADLLMRQLSFEPVEFMEWPEPETLVA